MVGATFQCSFDNFKASIRSPQNRNFKVSAGLRPAKNQEIDTNLEKCWGKIDSFLPWTQNLNGVPRPSFYTQVQNSCVC